MIDLFGLLKDTGAYKTVLGDKKNDRLSHAYLLLTPDGENLTEYLKIFASLLACENEQPCFNCRTCKLIGENSFTDVILFPKDGAATVSSEQVAELIGESFVKPLEANKKIFLITNAQNMNVSAQNKLLKTLEEPPRGVHIIMGATSEFPLLSTIKSRVKKIEIPSFTGDKLFEALKADYPDTERLMAAISCGDGTVGQAQLNYADESLKELTSLCQEVIVDMSSSSEVLKYSTKIALSKCDINKFLSVLELLFRDLLVYTEGKENLINNRAFVRLKEAKGYKTGSIINAIEKINQAAERKKFNANATMLIEWLLFQILEGKYKWQKL